MVKYEKIQNNKNLPITFLDVCVDGEGFHYIEKHWHNSIEIIVRIKGGSFIFDSGEYIWLEDNDVYIVNSQNIHATDEIPLGLKCEGIAIQLNNQFLKQFYSDIENTYFSQPSREVKNEIINIILDIRKWFYSDNIYRDIKIKADVINLLFTMLSQLSISKKKKIDIKSEKNRHRITKIINYIDAHYQEDISVSSLAQLFDYSKGHLEKIFKDNVGMSIKQYMTFIRSRNAMKDLIHTDLPIIDIAYQNGFPNVKSFVSSFKNEYGMTPAIYRRKMLK